MNAVRDANIEHIHSRKQHCCYGMGLGILILDDVYPGLPGDVRNASAWPYPVQYEIVENVDIKKLCYRNDVDDCLEPILKSARKLERMGCRAIAAECGFFSYFQKEVVAALSVPAFMSALLQVPWAQQLIGPDRKVTIVTSDAQISDEHLTSVGIDLDSNFEVVDLDEHIAAWRRNRSCRPSLHTYRQLRMLVPSCWNAPAIRHLRVISSVPSICLSTVGGLFLIMPSQSSSIAITMVMSEDSHPAFMVCARS